ncbi:3-hydroxybutyryl-CoA dehydrogenase [Exidia glandulosa HHB12029]|uniref:3-hydroxybutyryl-CoA dehydrogenase n=1 Tax=Exidia glandulosa HHB12029 TaxID=1314781 RepID=A0A165HPG0_EXIGL|nr:3-hydroxybutyryl-CoA dehydrogenase [Exidia glandulosa HHB12029]
MSTQARIADTLKAHHDAFVQRFGKSRPAPVPAPFEPTYTVPTNIADRAFTILGAGTLGRRIALMWLTNGETVHLFDTNPQTLEAARAYIEENLEPTIARLVPNGSKGILKTFPNRAEALENSWIVVEAVPEILQLKIDLLGELDAILPSDCILATNSSSYTTSEMYEKVVHKDRLVSTHYYMPPRANAVEVMPNAYTSPELVQFLLEQIPKHGLTAYHVRIESVGLIFNRIWAAIKREALFVIAQGVAGPTEVDSLMRDVFGGSKGVFDQIDEVGLDVALGIEEHYAQVRGVQVPPEAAAVLRSYVEQGKLGQKSGEGFYKYK